MGAQSGRRSVHIFEKSSKSNEQTFRKTKMGKTRRELENSRRTRHIFCTRGGNFQIFWNLVPPNCASVASRSAFRVGGQPYSNLSRHINSTQGFFSIYLSKHGISTALSIDFPKRRPNNRVEFYYREKKRNWNTKGLLNHLLRIQAIPTRLRKNAVKSVGMIWRIFHVQFKHHQFVLHLICFPPSSALDRV